MAKQQSKQTTLAVVNSEEANSVAIVSVLKQELNKLTKVSETPFKTSGGINIQGRTVDISTETSIPNLISLMAGVEAMEYWYTKAAEGALAPSLGSNYPVFKISGHTKEAIAHDINLKVEVISYSERKKELEELVKEAEQFLTKQDQFKIFQQKLATKFGQTS